MMVNPNQRRYPERPVMSFPFLHVLVVNLADLLAEELKLYLLRVWLSFDSLVRLQHLKEESNWLVTGVLKMKVVIIRAQRGRSVLRFRSTFLHIKLSIGLMQSQLISTIRILQQMRKENLGD
jgi:hypothetical protein